MVFLFKVLSHFPLAWLHALGALFGWLAWLASPTYRRHMRENMRQALGEAGERRWWRPAIAQAGKAALELPKLWLRPQEETAGRVIEVRGWELAEQALREGKGLFFMTPHLGCFEITAQYFSTFAPVTVLYRSPKHAGLQRMIETGRARAQLHLATADVAGVRALLKALRQGEAIGLLPDQTPKSGEGRWIDFFGRPAYTMTLAARLSEGRATIVLIWAERLAGGKGYRLHLKLPPPFHGDIEARARQINVEIEQLIRQCPAQYLWGYNRYKRPAGAEAPPATQVPATA